MSHNRDKPVLVDNPLLTTLGRRGRGAIINALRNQPKTVWSLRGLARQASVPPAVAARATSELQALGAVEVLRPGRDAQIRWLPDAPAARALAELNPPDLREAQARAFMGAFSGPPGTVKVLRWLAPHDVAADPSTPTRLAIVVRDEDDEEEALDATGPALDAVRLAGLPAPDVTTMLAELLGDDDVSRAIRRGTPVDPAAG